MAITVPCAKCATKLAAPDSAVGQRLRCPKCGTITTVPTLVPAEEVPVVEATVTPPKPKAKPVLAEEADERPRKRSRRDADDADDADDDDERPRGRKRRRYADDDDDYAHDHPRKRPRRKSGGGALVAVLVIGGLLLLAGVGVSVYFLVGKGAPFAKKTPVPPGWQQYSYPNDGFKAYFPSEPTVVTNPVNPMRGDMGLGFPGEIEVRDVRSVSSYTTGLFGGARDRVSVTVAVARFRNGVPRSMRNQMDQLTTTKVGNMESRKVRWLGHDAGEVVMGNTVMRIVYTDRSMIVVQINGPNGTRAKPEEEAGFFDNFETTD